MHHAFKLGEAEYDVELSRSADGYRLHVGGAIIPFTADELPGAVATRGDDVYIHLDGEVYQLRYEHPLQRLSQQAQGAAADTVRAPMPGSLVAVQVKPGQKVARGEVLLVMESMKMETTLHAGHEGTVQEVHYAPGQTFDRDAVLVTFAPAEAKAK